jgi:alkylation response protein AidB-like acyl-CoA dehydrogenase
MDFELNDEQRQIKETAREFLGSRYRSERIRELTETDEAFEQRDWDEMVGLGWPGLALPEEWGGQGLGTVELAVIFEEMGYALAPSPLLSTTVAGLALAAGGNDDQKEVYLRPLAQGQKRGTPAIVDAGSSGRPGEFTLEARSDGNGIVLEGEKVLVLDAISADFFVVATADGARHIVERDEPGVTVEVEPSMDLTRRLCSVRLDGVKVPAERTLPGAREDYLPALNRLLVTISAELTGVAQRTLDMAVAYAKERQQFGRAIGAYQAVSHRCAHMLLDTENARSATYYAAWTADAEPESLPLAASIAKAAASDAGCRVTHDSLQVHGGIGFTWEHDIHLFLKRARVDAALFGDASWHRERVASLVVDEGLGFASGREPAAAAAG